MSLLSQGLLGAVGQGADTAAKIMYDDIHAQRDEQMAQANDLRTQNLLRLKQQLDDQSFAKHQDATYSPYTVDNMPATYGDVKAAGAKSSLLNQQISDIQKGAEGRRQQAESADGFEGPATPSTLDTPNTGQLTPEESQQVAALNAQKPQITNTKEAALESKLANAKEISDAKLALQEKLNERTNEMRETVAKLRDDAFRDRTAAVLQAAQDKLNMALQLKQLAVGANNAGALKEAQLAIQKAEEERKNANAAQKLVEEADFTKPEVVALYNKYITAAGMPEGVKAVPEPAAPKKESKGLLGKIFGGSDADAAPPPKQGWTPANFSQSMAGGARGSYNYASLPKGSQPVPGKFTQDGRPVFRTPQGQLVAPKLQ